MLNRIIKKYLWIFTLVLLAGLAGLLSKGVGNLIVAKLGSGDAVLEQEQGRKSVPAPVVQRQTEKENQEAERVRDGIAIMKRNIFDSVTGSVLPRETDDQDGGMADGQTDQGPPPLLPCEGFNGQVLATVVSDDPAWSFATIKLNEETMLYRAGMLVDSNELTYISWRYVFFKQGNGECYFDIWASTEDKGQKMAKRFNRSMFKPPGQEPPMQGIEVLSDTKRRIDRAVVEKALSDQDALLKSARVLPYEKDGKVQGFKVYGIMHSGLLGQLGLNNGDIVQRINGVEITSADQALAAYAKFRSDSKIRVDLTRRGAPMTLEVDVK